MYSVEELKYNIFSKLTGEGGLHSDFRPDVACPTGRYEDKSYNVGMQQILVRIQTDEEFFDRLATKMIERYTEICKLRGLPENKYFDRVMDSYQCCLWARFYGLQMLNEEYQTKDIRSR